MNRLLLLFILVSSFFLLSCDSTKEMFLYDENDGAIYDYLKEQAAAECVKKNEIFSNLTVSTFNNYSSFNNFSDGTFIKLNSKAYIKIVGRPDDTTINFQVLTDGSYPRVDFIDGNDAYTITTAENNAFVADVGQGVCADLYTGTPGASSTSLSFSATRYEVTAGDVNDPDASGNTYNKRVDQLTLTTSYPAVFSIFVGAYTSTKKVNTDSSEESDAGNINVSSSEFSFTLSSEDSCISDLGSSVCSNSTIGANIAADVNESSNLVDASGSAIKSVYFDLFTI